MGIMSKDTKENPVNVGRHTESNSSTNQLTTNYDTSTQRPTKNQKRCKYMFSIRKQLKYKTHVEVTWA